jgi:hypothetical protein
MLAGAPLPMSKKTLCATDPNENVTWSPAATWRVFGVKTNPLVAATVRGGGGGGGLVPGPVPYPPPLHARAALRRAAIRKDLFVILMHLTNCKRR